MLIVSVDNHTRLHDIWLKKNSAQLLYCVAFPPFSFLCFVGYEPKGTLMDLLRRRRPANGAGGHVGAQGDLPEGRQGQDLLVQAGETADQALDRLIVEDLRRGALRRSRSVPLPASGPGLRLTDAGDGTASRASAGSRGECFADRGQHDGGFKEFGVRGATAPWVGTWHPCSSGTG